MKKIVIFYGIAVLLMIPVITWFLVRQSSQNTRDYILKRMECFRDNAFTFEKRNTSLAVQIQKDMKHLPYTTQYAGMISGSDTWKASRKTNASYNKNVSRVHEGIDLMYAPDRAGEVPVCSVSFGVIENIGWLTLGGYRIGIRSQKDVYYYYAHLSSYADGLKKGDAIVPGQFLGFMGNTGYGPEGTTGRFAVHLHFGIYLRSIPFKELSVSRFQLLDTYFFSQKLELDETFNNDEISINPYPFFIQKKWIVK